MYTLNSVEVHAVCYIFDARGNGRGGVSPTITGDHQNRITDYTAIVVEVNDERTDSTGIKPEPCNDNK